MTAQSRSIDTEITRGAGDTSEVGQTCYELKIPNFHIKPKPTASIDRIGSRSLALNEKVAG